MGKVRSIGIVPKYNHQVVSQLEDLLEQARKGEITEMLNVCRLDDGTYAHSWTGSDNLFELVGILERAKMATLKRMDIL